MSGPPARRLLGVLRRSIHDSPLRAATAVAALWALGTLSVSLLALVAQVALHGWQGLVAPERLLPALAFATASYLLRLFRWDLLARRVAPALKLADSLTVGAIGFALIMTPARAGEAIKLLLLRQRTSVPVATSASVFVIEKVSEASALASLALGASLLLPWAEGFRSNTQLVLLIGGLLGLALTVTFWHPLSVLLPRLPLIRRLLLHPRLARLWSNLVIGGDRVLSWPVVAAALALSLAARACDGLAIVLVAGLYGLDLPLAAGWLLIGSSGFMGGISMVPGGAGVAELIMIGLLLALGASPAAAVAITLTSRILILWLWVGLGLALALRYASGLEGSEGHEPAR